MKQYLLAATLALTATVAQAETQYVTGTVTRVKPDTVTVEVRKPQQVCYNVEVPIYGSTGGANAGDVLGGMIIGGLIGKGATNDDRGAAAGAVIGGMIAADKAQGQSIVGYRMEQQCKTEYTNALETRNNGYFLTIEVEDTILNVKTRNAYSVGDKVQIKRTYSF